MASYRSGFDADELTPVQREALDWIGRVHSGNATQDELAAWERWGEQSPAHAQARALAQKIVHLTRSHAPQPDEALTPVPLHERPVTRRIALGGLGLAVAGYGLTNPPMGLWPSIAELSSDYRTRVGEQQRVALAKGLSVELNTATSVRVQNKPGKPGIRLVAGEVAVNADLPAGQHFIATVDDGEVVAQKASLDLYKTGTGFRATCLSGAVTVRQAGAQTALGPGETVACVLGEGGPGKPYKVDTDVVAAWRHGQIVFRNAFLREVVAEINRYRRGEIILMSSRIGDRKLSGSFSLSHLDDMADHLAVFASVTASTLPGGIILLS